MTNQDQTPNPPPTPTKGEHSASEPPRLLDLSPHYEEASHRVYVDILNEALKKKQLLNIALSGDYGTGKSSILARVAVENEKDGVVSIAMSSVRYEENPPKEKKDGVESIAMSSLRLEEETTTAEGVLAIQKEIVKQLLYREKPSKMPCSRFQRLTHQSVKASILRACAFALYFLLLLFLITDSQPWAGWAAPRNEYDAKYWAATFLILFLLTILYQLTVHARPLLSKLTAGPVTLDFSNNTGSHFDKYLDEILYFFEISQASVVIFEDIDRFNNPDIFQDLKALNLLLNNAKQLAGRRIRFIYAIRDSIFVRKTDTGENQALSPFSRAKFFDLIVPVVPFISHTNAKSMLDSLLKKSNLQLSDELANVIAKFVPDMRLLKNVCNELLVFEKIAETKGIPGMVTGDNESDNRKNIDERLFTLILYKNIYLSDYEKLRTGTSKLDTLNTARRILLEEKRKQLEDSISVLQSNLNKYCDKPEVVRRFNRRIWNLFGCLARSVSLAQGNGLGRENFRIWLSDDTEARSEGETDSTVWDHLATPSNSIIVCIRNGEDTVMRFVLTREDFPTIGLDEFVDIKKPTVGQDELQSSLSEDKEKLAVLHKMGYRELKEENPRMETSNPLPALSEGFANLVRNEMGHGLAYELIASGFIDYDFVEYAAHALGGPS